MEETKQEEQTPKKIMTSIGVTQATRIRLKKFWLEQDEEQEFKNFDDLINGMIDYIETEEGQ